MKKTMLMMLSLFAFTCLAEIAKSSIAAKQMSHANGAFQSENPYVTDGLIIWYDGIWNKQLGVHDSNAATWKDLISGFDFNVINGHWEKNGFSGTASSESLAYPTSVSDEYRQVITNNGRTVEAVCTPLSMGCNVYSFGGVYQVYCVNNSVLWHWHRVHTGPMNIQSKGEIGELCSFTGTANLSKRAKWYFDGLQYYGGQNGALYTQCSFVEHYSQTRIGGKCIVYCIRIYNRVLTDEEIQLNWEVDKARFKQ